MEKNKKVKSLSKQFFSLITAVILVLSVFTLSGCTVGKIKTDGSTQAEKTVTFKIVYEDGSSKNVELKTQKSTLAEALVEANIIEYSKDGLYTTIDGVAADFSKDGSWWCITKGGEMTSVGLNDIVISDGETYEATYTK